MSKILRVLGYVWAAPLTLLALVYVLVFSALGWYKFTGRLGDALVWCVQQEKLPSLLSRVWAGWAGQTIGNVVVLRVDLTSDRGKMTLRHEQEHVRQCMILGIFQPLFYGIAWLAIKIACPRSSPYYTNPFEIEARRAAGQVVDVEGVIAKAAAAGKLLIKDKKIVLR